MTDELMEQRIAELNARNTEKAPVFDSEKRAYSVDDITSINAVRRYIDTIPCQSEHLSHTQRAGERKVQGQQ